MNILADISNEVDSTKRMIGSTKKGIGPTYAAKMNRIGLRVGDLKNWQDFEKKYKYAADWFEEK